MVLLSYSSCHITHHCWNIKYNDTCHKSRLDSQPHGLFDFFSKPRSSSKSLFLRMIGSKPRCKPLRRLLNGLSKMPQRLPNMKYYSSCWVACGGKHSSPNYDHHEAPSLSISPSIRATSQRQFIPRSLDWKCGVIQWPKNTIHVVEVTLFFHGRTMRQQATSMRATIRATQC